MTNLKPFKAGVSGNPGGRPKLPLELRVARRENTATLIRLIHQYMGMSKEEARQRLSKPGTLQTEEMIQGQITKAIEGDTNAFRFIIEVMCGKIPDHDEISATESMSDQEKLELMREAVKMLERQISASGSKGG